MLRYDAEVTLVRSARDPDNLGNLRSTLAELDAALSQRAAETERTQSTALRSGSDTGRRLVCCTKS